MARAWIIWGLSALFMFYKYAIEVSPSVMTQDLMRTFNINGAETGNLAACYFYAYLIMQIPAGLLLDRFGPKKMTSFAILLAALGTLAFCRATNLFEASLGRFLTGAGASFAALNCLKLIANWFPKRNFAFMVGLMMTLGMLGAVGGQAPLNAFIQAFHWQKALEIIAGIGVILAILFWLVVKDRPAHHKEELLVATRLSLLESCKRIFKHSQSWTLSIYSGLAFAPISVFGGLWGVPFLKETFGLSSMVAAHEVSLVFIGFAAGAPLAGWLSEKLGFRKPIMLWGTLVGLLAITFVLYAPITSSVWLGLNLFIFGFSLSAFLLSFTMIRESHSLGIAATAVGFMNAFNALFGALSDPLTGKFLDMGWQGTMVDGARIFPVAAYKAALATLPIFLLLSLILLYFIKETYRKEAPMPSSLP